MRTLLRLALQRCAKTVSTVSYWVRFNIFPALFNALLILVLSLTAALLPQAEIQKVMVDRTHILKNNTIKVLSTWNEFSFLIKNSLWYSFFFAVLVWLCQSNFSSKTTPKYLNSETCSTVSCFIWIKSWQLFCYRKIKNNFFSFLTIKKSKWFSHQFTNFSTSFL